MSEKINKLNLDQKERVKKTLKRIRGGLNSLPLKNNFLEPAHTFKSEVSNDSKK